MKGLAEDAGPDRLRRQARVPRHRLVCVVLLCVGALGLAGGAGWWWQIAPVSELTLETQHKTQALELELGLSGAQGSNPDLPSSEEVAEPRGSVLTEAVGTDDDVSALVRWQDLLSQHQLRDWQGRSVPSAKSPGAAGAERAQGALWRLEGAATYEQGVALLQSMARHFPCLVLLQVQVQQMPASDLLQWRLDLRWSAPTTGVAQPWPAGGTFDARNDINPFALERLQPNMATRRSEQRTQTGVAHVLPQAPLQEIRLIGVVGVEDERLAVVVWEPPSGRDPGAEHARPASLPHRLRSGQMLGLEQTRVVGIAPRSVVLQSSHRVADGRPVERHQVLALASPELEQPVSERRGP